MNQETKLIAVPVGNAIEYYDLEGDEETARMILKPYGISDSPVELRLCRERTAKDLAQRNKFTSPVMAPLPEMPISKANRRLSMSRQIIGFANL